MKVFTDGSCSGKSGGWGWVELSDDNLEFCDCERQSPTTNNKMEIQAVISFLEDAPFGKYYHLFSDSMYVLKTIVDGGKGKVESCQDINGWIKSWEISNFEGKKNVELWKTLQRKLLVHLKKGSTFYFQHVKAHQGNYGNEKADKLAKGEVSFSLEI